MREHVLENTSPRKLQPETPVKLSAAEFPELPGLKVIDRNPGDAVPYQPECWKADSCCHPAHLSVFTFRQHHTYPGCRYFLPISYRRMSRRHLRRRVQHAYLERLCMIVPAVDRNRYTFPEFIQRLESDGSIYLHPILFLV